MGAGANDTLDKAVETQTRYCSADVRKLLPVTVTHSNLREPQPSEQLFMATMVRVMAAFNLKMGRSKSS